MLRPRKVVGCHPPESSTHPPRTQCSDEEHIVLSANKEKVDDGGDDGQDRRSDSDPATKGEIA
jgi:hypothetical protein